VRTGTVRTASGRWFDPRSADGKLRIVTPKTGTNFAVGVAPVSGGPTDSYGQLPACGQDTPPVTSLQFVGRSRSIVYETVCTHPFYDLYSIAPDGTGLREISGIQPNAGAPALSSDGTQIAYTWAPPRGLSGSEIRVANADGTDARTLVSATSNCTSEDPPTWSPDGKTILYSETTIGFTSACPGDPGSELYTIPAVGGARHDLGVAGSYPIWGPTRIAYAGPEGLTTANPDGSDPIVVATLSGVRAWSSDGRLAYMAFDPSPTVIVGSQPVQLPFVQVTSLGWSPDGTRFVVTAQKTKKAPLDLYTVKTDGTDWLRLTRNYDTLGASWR
jgi:Tol biopolymer transport system component